MGVPRFSHYTTPCMEQEGILRSLCRIVCKIFNVGPNEKWFTVLVSRVFPILTKSFVILSVCLYEELINQSPYTKSDWKRRPYPYRPDFFILDFLHNFTRHLELNRIVFHSPRSNKILCEFLVITFTHCNSHTLKHDAQIYPSYATSG